MDYKKGLWTVEEDTILMDYISKNGEGKWNRIAKNTGLKRCGKSCRLRWLNYLCPSVKRGDFSEQEDDLIIRLHKLLGNRWSLIAGRVPGRTDNQVKNYWNSHLSKKLGISKDKKKLGTAMKLSRKGGEEKEIIRLVGDSTSKSSSDGGDSRVVGSSQVKEGTQNAIKAPDPQEPEMSECYWSSNWLPNDHLDQNIPSLMELLNGYPFDEVWHDF